MGTGERESIAQNTVEGTIMMAPEIPINTTGSMGPTPRMAVDTGQMSPAIATVPDITLEISHIKRSDAAAVITGMNGLKALRQESWRHEWQNLNRSSWSKKLRNWKGDCGVWSARNVEGPGTDDKGLSRGIWHRTHPRLDRLMVGSISRQMSPVCMTLGDRSTQLRSVQFLGRETPG